MPRSRTAWLSAVCNTVPEAICYHEPTATLDRWESVVGLVTKGTYRYAGAADSGLGLHLPRLIDMMPGVKVVVVWRDPDQVRESLRTLFPFVGEQHFLDILQGHLTNLRDDVDVRWVQFPDLVESRKVVRLLRWLMPEATICPEKVIELQRLNVQADMERVARDVRAAVDDGRMAHLLGAS